MVYKLVLTPPSGTYENSVELTEALREAPSHAVLETCKQIYHEAHRPYMSATESFRTHLANTTFTITNTMEDRLLERLVVLPPKLWAQVRRVDFLTPRTDSRGRLKLHIGRLKLHKAEEDGLWEVEKDGPVGVSLGARLMRFKLGEYVLKVRAMVLAERTIEGSEADRTRRQVLRTVEIMGARWRQFGPLDYAATFAGDSGVRGVGMPVRVAHATRCHPPR